MGLCSALEGYCSDRRGAEHGTKIAPFKVARARPTAHWPTPLGLCSSMSRDHNRPQQRLSRLGREAPEPQPFEQGRVPYPQHDEVEQQHEADGAADAEPVEKAEEALHGPETGFFPNSLTDPLRASHRPGDR